LDRTYRKHQHRTIPGRANEAGREPHEKRGPGPDSFAIDAQPGLDSVVGHDDADAELVGMREKELLRVGDVEDVSRHGETRFRYALSRRVSKLADHGGRDKAFAHEPGNVVLGNGNEVESRERAEQVEDRVVVLRGDAEPGPGREARGQPPGEHGHHVLAQGVVEAGIAVRASPDSVGARARQLPRDHECHDRRGHRRGARRARVKEEERKSGRAEEHGRGNEVAGPFREEGRVRREVGGRIRHGQEDEGEPDACFGAGAAPREQGPGGGERRETREDERERAESGATAVGRRARKNARIAHRVREPRRARLGTVPVETGETLLRRDRVPHLPGIQDGVVRPEEKEAARRPRPEGAQGAEPARRLSRSRERDERHEKARHEEHGGELRAEREAGREAEARPRAHRLAAGVEKRAHAEEDGRDAGGRGEEVVLRRSHLENHDRQRQNEETREESRGSPRPRETGERGRGGA
jgi:hypothetical protein